MCLSRGGGQPGPGRGTIRPRVRTAPRRGVETHGEQEIRRMARYRVKAFFMHEHEEAAARQAENNATITETEWTQGYVMGVVDEHEIAQLTAQGLVVTPIEQVETQDEADAAPVRSSRPDRALAAEAGPR